jgi:hypothetical protein
VVKVKKAGTFKQVLDEFKVHEKEHQDIALLNGINLNDQVKINTQIKLIKKGK